MKYPNSEGYADPTAGAALARIDCEERLQKQWEQKKKHSGAKKKKRAGKHKRKAIASKGIANANDPTQGWLSVIQQIKQQEAFRHDGRKRIS